jgi:hypothetical protein
MATKRKLQENVQISKQALATLINLTEIDIARRPSQREWLEGRASAFKQALELIEELDA